MSDNKNLLQEIFRNVFGDPDFNEAVIRRYFGTDYKQSVDGKELGFEEFLRHIKAVKQSTKSLSFRFKTMVQEGDIVFSNHLVRTETPEGRSAEVHVIAEFRFRDGKIVSCEELTRLISGDEADRGMASRY